MEVVWGGEAGAAAVVLNVVSGGLRSSDEHHPSCRPADTPHEESTRVSEGGRGRREQR